MILIVFIFIPIIIILVNLVLFVIHKLKLGKDLSYVIIWSLFSFSHYCVIFSKSYMVTFVETYFQNTRAYLHGDSNDGDCVVEAWDELHCMLNEVIKGFILSLVALRIHIIYRKIGFVRRKSA